MQAREKHLDWRAAVAVARRQFGVISLAQLAVCGFTPSGVQKLSSAGKLHRVHQSVYSLSPAALSGEGNRMAAVLACGPGSLLACRSAGSHLGLITNSSSVIDVMTPRQVRRGGIRARHLPILDDRDRIKHNGIPCTSVARTLLDLAAVGRPDELEAVLEQAVELEVFDLTAISGVIERNAGHRGVRRLRLSLASLTEAGPKFRSKFERRFLPITRSAGMPEPLINHVIQLPDGPVEVDYYWPDLRLVVELDGFQFHRHRRNFREDRRRDRRLGVVGIHCLRYVWEDLDNPAPIVIELRQLRRRREPAETRPDVAFVQSR